MKPIPVIISLGLIGTTLFPFSLTVLAQEDAPERPRTPPMRQQEMQEAPTDMTSPELRQLDPRVRPGRRAEEERWQNLERPLPLPPTEQNTGDRFFDEEAEIMPISLPSSNQRVSREMLQQRREEVQLLREQNQMNRCEIFSRQMTRIALMRTSQSARIINRYSRIIDRLETIVSWMETQEVDTSTLQDQIASLQLKQGELAGIFDEYTQRLESMPSVCVGEDLGDLGRQELGTLRDSARELTNQNTELIRSIREDILSQLRTLNQ